MTQQESFGAGDIIQRLISEGGSHWCLQPGPGANAKGRDEGRRALQAGWAEGSSGIATAWHTLAEDEGRVQTLLVEEERWLRQSVSGTNTRRGFRAAGARSQLQPSQRFRD